MVDRYKTVVGGVCAALGRSHRRPTV